MSAPEVRATISVEVERRRGRPTAYLVRRTRTRTTRTALTAPELATLAAEAVVALKILVDDREA